MEVVVARRGVVVLRLRHGEPPPSVAAGRSGGRCSRLLLLWTFAVGFAAGLFMFASHVLAAVAAAVLFAAMCLYTCLCLNNAAPEEEQQQPPVLLLPGQALPPALRVAVMQQAVNGRGGGLRQEDVEAGIPAFEYSKQGSGGAAEAAAAEQCAVCIGVVRRGETVRRLPACGHAFHAACIDGWLRAHATCPMCRADVKVVAGGGAAV
uniref:RING-type E3 ubiquitin transferase n=1 Tax=Oryza punctata TaxID=4537 RepID=A0A0E0MLY3_ORYPU